LKGGRTIQERRYDIDWLRILAIMMVFLFHCARFFGGGRWHLKNPGEESFLATLFIGVLDLWIMPLFFLLSGASSYYALKSSTGGQYLLDRVKRILIPLYGVGACILLLPQVYFEAIKSEAEDHGREPVGESVPLSFPSLDGRGQGEGGKKIAYHLSATGVSPWVSTQTILFWTRKEKTMIPAKNIRG